MNYNSSFVQITLIIIFITLLGCESTPVTSDSHLSVDYLASSESTLPRNHIIFDINTLTSGDRHSCTLKNSEIFCWGETGYFDHDYGPEVLKPPKLVNPTLFTSSDYTNCATDDSGFKCWGRFGETLTNNAPLLSNIKQLSLGRGHVCAIHDNSVTCWGDNRYSQLETPLLNSPTQISSLGFNNCVIDRETVKCWGATAEMQMIPPLTNPRQISVGWGFACALHEGGVSCWGSDFNSVVFKVPKLIDPIHISASTDHVCVIETNGVKCWGNSQYGKTIPPKLLKPRHLSSGGNHTCATDDTGIVCWGLDYYAKSTPPRLISPTELTASNERTCAIEDNSNVICWGYEEVGNFSLPRIPLLPPNSSFINPTKISLGEIDTCVLDDLGVGCLGSGLSISTDLLLNPIKISSGISHACALDELGVICSGIGYVTTREPDPGLGKALLIDSEWEDTCVIYEQGSKCLSYSLIWGPKVLPLLESPREFEMNYFFSCAIDNRGVYCWGRNGDQVIPGLINPRSLSVYDKLACVIDDSGLVCWDEYYNKITNLHTYTNPNQVAVGKDYFCVLDDLGVSCWSKYPAPDFVRWYEL